MNESLKLAYGDTLVLICAVLFSGHILCCDHFVSRGNPIKISAVQFVTTAIISTVMKRINLRVTYGASGYTTTTLLKKQTVQKQEHVLYVRQKQKQELKKAQNFRLQL
jgi:hypothetical protein